MKPGVVCARNEGQFLSSVSTTTASFGGQVQWNVSQGVSVSRASNPFRSS